MRYLTLSSLLFVLMSCGSVYKELHTVPGGQTTNGNVNSLQQFKPVFTVALYNTSVDVVGNHLSGLLLIKKMPDSTIRMVFSNEMGFKFFDFEFSPTGDFKVYSIIKKMNRKSVLKTLRKDLELVLMQGMDNPVAELRKDSSGLLYHIYKQTKGYNCYITNAGETELLRMERASASKVVATTIMQNYVNGIPDTIGVTHHNFNFTIGLKRIER